MKYILHVQIVVPMSSELSSLAGRPVLTPALAGCLTVAVAAQLCARSKRLLAICGCTERDRNSTLHF